MFMDEILLLFGLSFKSSLARPRRVARCEGGRECGTGGQMKQG